MNVSNTMKTLPLAAALAVGLALMPAVSMADKGGKGHDKHSSSQSYSHHGGKHNAGGKRSHNDRDYGHNDRHNYGHTYGHDHHDRRVVKNYIYPARTRTVTEYVVRDYGHEHYLGLGGLGFIIGLHTDDIDVILHK